MPKSGRALYQRYFQERQFERLDLFEQIADAFPIQRVLYPGSFVHITPSFVFPDVVYVDNDKQARQFFRMPEILTLIAERKVYPQEATVTFHDADYRHGFDESPATFDLLISQYAGFVGLYCKPYLKPGGFLAANNSHGDAGMAAIDADYQLRAVFSARNGAHHMSTTQLEAYFVPKVPMQLTREYLEQRRQGIGYTRTASVYVFQKVR